MNFGRVNALLLKYYYITINRLDRVFDVFYWPLMGLLIWGFTAYYLKDITDNSQILNIFLGGVILWTFYQRALQDMGTYVLEDFWSRNVTNLLSTPLTSAELITSTVLFGFFRSVITFAFLSLAGLVIYSFNIFNAGVFIVLLFSINLLLFGWSFGIVVCGLIFRFGQKIQVFAWSFPWLVQPFSAVFWPVAALPLWLQKVSLLLPSTYAFEGIRQGFAVGTMNWAYFWQGLVLNLALIALAYIFFAYSLNSAREKGVLARVE